MTIENHVVSLDLAKRLKELGVLQNSFFFWTNHDCQNESKNINEFYLQNKDGEDHHYYEFCCSANSNDDEKYSTYLATELGEWLPEWFDSGKISDGDFVCRFMEKHIDKNHHSFAENETDARAKMLIYIIENKIINVEDLK